MMTSVRSHIPSRISAAVMLAMPRSSAKSMSPIEPRGGAGRNHAEPQVRCSESGGSESVRKDVLNQMMKAMW